MLDAPAFAPLFAAGSRAEVSISGLVRGHAVAGQVDRLAVTATEVWIVDYKTNRPPPSRIADVDPAYMFQMAVYRAALTAIYPRHAVRCVLLWTDGPFTMELPPAQLDEALDVFAGGFACPTPSPASGSSLWTIREGHRSARQLSRLPPGCRRRAVARRLVLRLARPRAASGVDGPSHTLAASPCLIGPRQPTGQVFALRDTCPHRGTLLSRGAFDGREVECPYHGWRFATDGRCAAIPSQTADQRPQPADIHARAYPVVEDQGNIWVFFGGDSAAAMPPVPEMPATAPFPAASVTTFECNIDLAVIGLMDPAHGAFVHRSALWRTKPDSIHEKRKSFSPLPESEGLGWRMDRHPASANSRAYRLFLGGQPETEITYALPSVRIEHASTGKFYYCGLTACTPLTADRTEVHHVMYWNVPGGALRRCGIGPRMAHRFLDQDRRAVMAMQEGLAFDPPTMLVQDADTQVRWYYRLKREWLCTPPPKAGRREILARRPCLKWRS